MYKVFFITCVAVLISACSSRPVEPIPPHSEKAAQQNTSEQQIQIKGTLSYPQPRLLKEGSLARVVLMSRNADDVPESTEIYESVFRAHGPSPLNYRLELPFSLINPENRYGIEAQIFSEDERLLLSTRQMTPVLSTISQESPFSTRRTTPVTEIHNLTLQPVPETLNAGQNGSPGPHVFMCQGQALLFSTYTQQNTLELYLADEMVALEQIQSASGSKYQAEDTLFWRKGNSAMLSWKGQVYSHCKRQVALEPRDRASRRAVIFRGQGNEPGWLLEMEQGDQVNLLMDYGQDRYSWPVPATTFTDGTVRWSLERNMFSPAAEIALKKQACTDTMSDEHFKWSVTVSIHQNNFPLKVLKGCGKLVYSP